MTIKEQILELFKTDNELSVKEVVDRLHVTKQSVHTVMNQLMADGRVEKLGKVPKTIYRIIAPSAKKADAATPVSASQNKFLQKHFLLITETGKMLEGTEGFEVWCRQRKLPFEKTIDEFISTQQKYDAYFNKEGIINGMEKLKNTKGYEKINLDKLYYLDFYAIERFGKTRLGTLLHYAKQGQNKFLMKKMMDEINERIKRFVTHHRFDAIGFVPPTIRREVQIMKFIQTHLHLSLPVLEIKKVSGIIPVPQKSLNKLEERITNAQNTFAITDRRNFEHVLLIDDAVGSGATLNEIAGKLKQKNTAKYITSLAISGSFKGFDVITDV
jgi:hypothetical protein